MAPVSFVEIFLPCPGNPFSPLGDLWRIPLGPPPTPSWPFAVLRGPSWKSFCLFLEILSLPLATSGGSLSGLLQPLRGPSPFFVVLRGNLFAFSWKSFLPLATLGGSLSGLLQPLRGPSPFFVVLRGNLFALSWKSFLSPWRPLADPSRASSNPFVALRRSSWSFVEIFLPFPGNPFSPWRPLVDPSRVSSNPFVALRRSSWSFVEIFLPFPGNPFSPWRPLADPSRASSNPFVALRGQIFALCSRFFVDPFVPFVDNSFSLLVGLR